MKNGRVAGADVGLDREWDLQGHSWRVSRSEGRELGLVVNEARYLHNLVVW